MTKSAGNEKNEIIQDLIVQLAAVTKERDELAARVEELVEILDVVVLNAVVGPDASMGGCTDCYHVPLDDIESARNIISLPTTGARERIRAESFREASQFNWIRILSDYRCQHWADGEGGDGAQLVDVLSPTDTVKEGMEELASLADHISGALIDAANEAKEG